MMGDGVPTPLIEGAYQQTNMKKYPTLRPTHLAFLVQQCRASILSTSPVPRDKSRLPNRRFTFISLAWLGQ
ncbi:Uncharacterized protein TCM_037548 [Theobroma cacao]|uniref:Uncharacterized protein n=1 Tax=Theobroma cacao TaxID=3641 RepID=A0A061GMB5_THECC|nr:Uncharacterized protein TCM_037548 [Theobroma cacao]